MMSLLAVVLAAQLTLLEGKVQTGTVVLGGTRDDVSNFQFISKFGYGIGSGDYVARFKVRSVGGNSSVEKNMNLGVFLDEDWAKIQAAPDCSSRVPDARKNHALSFTDYGEWDRSVDGKVTQNIRSHIWYFVAMWCDGDLSNSPLHIDYEITMTQDGGSQLGVEMRGMITLNFLVLMCLSAFLVRYCSRCFAFVSSAGKLHQVILALSCAIILQFASQSCHTLHLWVYQSNGTGTVFLDWLSEVLFMLSQVIQTTLLIAIAMGYTLLPSRGNSLEIVKSIALVSFIIHVVLVSFAKLQEDSASKYHENDGAIGWVLLSVRLMLFVWFVFATQASQQESGLRLQEFLRQFRFAGSMYFLAYPSLFIIVQLFAEYLQHPIMQIGLLAMQTASNVCLSELFLSRGTYFKVSTLSSSFLPGSSSSAFDKLS